LALPLSANSLFIFSKECDLLKAAALRYRLSPSVELMLLLPNIYSRPTSTLNKAIALQR
jgi:hypothetical protein